MHVRIDKRLIADALEGYQNARIEVVMTVAGAVSGCLEAYDFQESTFGWIAAAARKSERGRAYSYGSASATVAGLDEILGMLEQMCRKADDR